LRRHRLFDPSFLRALCLFLLFFVLYSLLRLPVLSLGIPYYDDGDTLYHAFSILSGRVPYRDDIGHHFFGYLLPFVLYGKLFPLDEWSFFWIAGLHQSLTALFVFLIGKEFAGRSFAVLSSLLVLAAREPWVIGFYQQYQTNTLMVMIWYLSLKAINDPKAGDRSLSLAFLVAGLAFVFDQRALLMSITPVVAWVLLFRRDSVILLRAAPMFYFVVPIVGVLYLLKNDALTPFVEQTFKFPLLFRTGQSSLLDQLLTCLTLHRHILSTTPVLLLFAMLGVIPLLRTRGRGEQVLILSFALSVFLMTLLGGRDYEYYTVPWIPFMGLASLGLVHWRLFQGPVLSKTLPALFFSPVLLSYIQLIENFPTKKDPGDGVSEVAQFLKMSMNSEDTVYVWAYRLDLYVQANKLSYFPEANRMMIHPDHAIVHSEERRKHVFPKYDERFRQRLEAAPPSYLVTFTRDDVPPLWSAADDAVRTTLSRRYDKVFEVQRRNFRGDLCLWRVFRLRKSSLKEFDS
jgi:hypothetical protein